ncbi:uncharacterized protein LOC117226019 [Megalopta genalis]|uniref:uncharacterized protein LOC117226019 n=1 Tax=Megalopta genalis TaxID=115081 RepID=UPI003FD43B82
MSRSICILFAVLAVLQAALASPVNEPPVVKTEILNLQVTDLVEPNLLNDSSSLAGVDLEVGSHRSGETLYRARNAYANSEQNAVILELHLTIPSGIIHYVQAVNDPSSYAVISSTSNTLGSSESVILLGLPPRTFNVITFTVAAH